LGEDEGFWGVLVEFGVMLVWGGGVKGRGREGGGLTCLLGWATRCCDGRAERLEEGDGFADAGYVCDLAACGGDACEGGLLLCAGQYE
jgi:hypothetical protein